MARIVRSGNYCCSSIRVASVDEEKKNHHRKITITHTQTTCLNCIALHADKKKCSKNQLKYKQTQIATFNVRALNKTELLELTASAIDHKHKHNMHSRTHTHIVRILNTTILAMDGR